MDVSPSKINEHILECRFKCMCVCVYKNIYTFMYLYINIYIKQQVKTEVFIGHICLNFDSKLGLFSTLLNSRFQMF